MVLSVKEHELRKNQSSQRVAGVVQFDLVVVVADPDAKAGLVQGVIVPASKRESREKGFRSGTDSENQPQVFITSSRKIQETGGRNGHLSGGAKMANVV